MAMQYRKENKKRSLKQRVLILCEGKTERLYLQGIKNTLSRAVQRDVEINISQAKSSEPVTFINEILHKRNIAKQEKQPYREIWMVFDDDNRNLKNIFQKLEKERIMAAYSSISIEFWFILHFEKTNKQFAKHEDAHRYLLCLKPDYEKTNPDLWKEFETLYLQNAKNNALWLRQQQGNPEMYNVFDCKPYTNIVLLVEKLLHFEENN
jgi:hypothetical protein